MSSYPPPSPTWPILNPDTFNNSFFTSTDEGLSLENAFKYFLRLTGGTISGNLNVLLDFNNSGNTYLNNLYLDNILVNATATELNYNAGITLGIGSASKVLTLNASNNVEGINVLTLEELVSNAGLTVQSGHLTMSASSHIKINSTSDYTNTTDASIYSKGGIYIEKSIQALQNVISNGLLTNSITLNGTAITSTATEINYLSGITLGTITASKVLTVDANSNINSILRLTKSANNAQMVFTNGTSTANVYHFNNSDFYFGTTSANNLVFQTNAIGRVSISSAGVLNIQAGWAISGTTVSASATELNYNDITTIGTAEASKALILDASKQIKEITKLQIGTNTTLGGRDLMILNSGANAGFRVGSNETTGNCLTFQWTYVGSNNANNKFSIDFFGVSNQFAMLRSGNVGIGTGTPAYTLDVNGSSNSTSLYLNGSQITATATELNYLDFSGSYVLGVCEASKAVVLDASRNTSNINSLTTDYLVVNTALNSSNASASFRKLNLQSIANNFGVISVQGGNNNSPFFGSTDSILYCESSNVSPICFELNVSNLTSATSTNSLRFGTTTANDLNLFTNQVERLNIASTGAVKILSTTQTSSPTTGALLVDGGVGINKALWVNNNISTNGRLRSVNGGIGLEHNDTVIGLITYVDSAGIIKNDGAYFGTNTNHPLMLQTNELERLRISNTGNVSIGNTNNTYKLDVSGDINCSGNFRVAGTALPSTTDLEKIAGITNGEAYPNKALVLDFFSEIKDIGKITTRELEVDDDIVINSGNLSVREDLLGTGGNITIDDRLSCRSIRITDVTAGLNVKTFGSKIDILSGNNFGIGMVSNDAFFLFANDNYTGFYIMPNGNFGFNTNDPQYTADIEGSCNALSYYINGTQITSSATELNYLDLTTGAGTAEASKALVLDASRNITNINAITTTGALTMSGVNRFITMRNSGLTNGQNVSVVLGRTNATNEQGEITFTYSTTAGSSMLSLGHFGGTVLNVFSSGNVSIGNTSNAYKLDVNGSFNATSLYVGGVQITATPAELNVLDGITATVAELNVLDGITASTTELNYVDVIAGTADASKALVLDANKDITGIDNMSMAKISLNNAISFPTPLHCGSTASNKIIGVFNNTTTFYGFGALGNALRLQTDDSFEFYINSTGTAVGDLRTTIDDIKVGILQTTASSNATTGALTVAGGLGVSGNIYTNGVLVTNNGQVSSSTSSGALRSAGGLGVAGSGFFGVTVACGQTAQTGLTSWLTSGIQFRTGATSYTTSSTGTLASAVFSSFARPTLAAATAGTITTEASTVYIANSPLAGTNMTITDSYALWINAGRTILKDTTASTNSTSGALVVSGGVGIGGNVNLGSSTLTGTNCVASLRAVQLGATTNNYGVLSLLSNSASYISPAFASSSSLIYFDSDNLTKEISFEINVANGAGTTSTNPVRMGTVSNNDLVLFTNKVARMIISSGGRLLYNTSSFFSNERISLNGSVAVAGTSDWVDGSYQITGSFRTSDNANEIQIQQASGGDAFIGTKSNNKFCFMTNNTRAMNIDTNQRVGIGTASPSTILHVSGSVSTTVSTGTYGQATETAYNTTQLAPITFNNSLRTSSSIYCGGSVFVFSDRRIKKDIEQVSDDYSDTFFDKIDIIKYRLKNENETSNKYLGVVAQEVFKNGYTELINMAENENMKKETDDDIEGIVMNVDYAKIALLCVQQIKKLKKELKEMKDFISTLDIQEV